MYCILLALITTFISSPVVEMREEPTKTSKMASQALYGEKVDIQEEQSDWAKIQTPDGYIGWVKKNVFYQTENPSVPKPDALFAKVNRLAVHVYDVQDTEWGPITTLPFETKLEVLDQLGDPNGRWLQVKLVDGTSAYIQRGDIVLNSQLLSKDELGPFSLRFLGLPYTYGGRSSFGYDCSGFVQMLYRQMGISIPRDSKNQVQWEGFREIAIDELQPGDLIFFGREYPKINHVGMYLGQGKFIHANVLDNKPYITISKLSEPSWNGEGKLKNRQARTLK